ncbi:hypothetical protein Tco_0080605 [Tanacetum coccineum]
MGVLHNISTSTKTIDPAGLRKDTEIPQHHVLQTMLQMRLSMRRWMTNFEWAFQYCYYALVAEGIRNVSKTSNDSLLAGVNTPRSDEDRLKLNELMEFYTKLTVQAQAQKIVQEVIVKDVNLSVDEVTLAQALAALESAKVQEKANVIEEPSESITTTPTLITTTAATTVTAASTRPKDKWLVIHEEEQATTPKEVRLAREKVIKEEEANIVSWDNVQAMIDVDYQMSQMQVDEQRIDSKKQKLEEDKETAELQRLREVVPHKEEVAIDAIPLATKPPSIIDYKIHKEGKKTYYQIIKADGSLKIYLVFSHMLKSFNREDLETLWKLVKAKHRSTRPEEGFEECVIGWLKTMFESTVKNKYGGINRITEYWIGSYMIHVEYIH